MNTTRELQTDEPVTRLGTLTTASMGVPRPQIIATADIPARPEAVFCFLADLENHAAIARGFVELLSVKRRAGRASEAIVRLRGPLGISRTASTAILQTRMAEPISGRAWVGSRTRASVSWNIETASHGSTVSLRVMVEATGLPDSLLLALGGRWWLKRRFANALRCLSHQLGPAPRPATDGDSAVLVLQPV